MRITYTLTLLFSLTFAFAERTVASEPHSPRCIDSVCFQTSAEIGGEAIPLRGLSRFRYWMFDVYTAALYAPKGWRHTPGFGLDSAIVLVIEYHRAISGEDIANSALTQIRRWNEIVPDKVWKDIARFHRAYSDVNRGDRYRLQFEPEQGATLFFNDKVVITIPGSEFAHQYFRIWLDPAMPLDEKLRDELYGKL